MPENWENNEDPNSMYLNRFVPISYSILRFNMLWDGGWGDGGVLRSSDPRILSYDTPITMKLVQVIRVVIEVCMKNLESLTFPLPEI